MRSDVLVKADVLLRRADAMINGDNIVTYDIMINLELSESNY